MDALSRKGLKRGFLLCADERLYRLGDLGSELVVMSMISVSSPRRVVGNMLEVCAYVYVRRWRPYSRLLLSSDSAFWTISWDMKELAHTADTLGVSVGPSWLLWRRVKNQCVFWGSHFDFLLSENRLNSPHRLATAYFHGRPGCGVDVFDACYKSLQRNHEKISRIQVSHSQMRDVVLESGIAVEKVFLIPIGINASFLGSQKNITKADARDAIGIPQSAVVVGSFQKDGEGWDEGLNPKMEKGPDVFVQTMVRLKERVPELFVLLSGPARGYVKQGLQKAGVPYSHHFLKNYMEIPKLYRALDLYVVASREEGGPKSVLESMACGVPLVTTRVGQAMDLVQHGVNGWMVDVEDVDGLANWAETSIKDPQLTRGVVATARGTAAANTYDAQTNLWGEFMKGFVEVQS